MERPRPIQHPQDKQRQQGNYSGKKRRPTRKHLAAVDERSSGVGVEQSS